jgi:hypothetical protein
VRSPLSRDVAVNCEPPTNNSKPEYAPGNWVGIVEPCERTRSTEPLLSVRVLSSLIPELRSERCDHRLDEAAGTRSGDQDESAVVGQASNPPMKLTDRTRARLCRREMAAR